MSDPISREDAINAIYHHFPQMTMRECADVLHEVPPAEVTLCHLGSPCEYQNADIAMPSARPEQSSEIQDILEYLDTVLHPIISPDHWSVYSELHDMISMLPFAQPERKKGKWKVWNIQDYAQRPTGRKVGECPFCGYLTSEFRWLFESSHKLTNFCPNCGASMNGERKENDE